MLPSYHSLTTQRVPLAPPSCAERTVALLVFKDVKASPLADLMDVAQRQKTASELNAAILAAQSQVGQGGGWDLALMRACVCVSVCGRVGGP